MALSTKERNLRFQVYIPSVLLRIDALKEKDLSISRAEDFRRENAQLRRELARPGPRWLEMLASRVPHSLGPKILNQEKYNGRKNLDSHFCKLMQILVGEIHSEDWRNVILCP